MKLIFLIFTSSILISESSQFHQEEIIRWMEPTHLRMIEKLRQGDSASSTTVSSSSTMQPSTTTPEPTSTTPTLTTQQTTTTSTTTPEPTSTTPTSTTQQTTTTSTTTPEPTSPTPTTTTQQTTTTSTTTTAKPTPPHCTPGQRKPVNGTCRDYVECDKTFVWVPKSCSTWCHNFNPQTSKCDWSWKYPCVYTTTTETPCTTKPTITVTTSPTTIETTTTAACTNGQKKIYKAGDCNDYLECDSGTWVEKSCGWFHYFDASSLSCKITVNPWHKC